MERPYLIIVAEFNKNVTDGLLNGALKALKEDGVPDNGIEVMRVPGTWEIPFAAHYRALSKHPCAIITLGAVIKHETSHDFWINQAVFPRLQWLTEELMIPVSLGIITCDSEAQAVSRSQDDQENRGYVAAKAAVQMVKLLTQE